MMSNELPPGARPIAVPLDEFYAQFANDVTEQLAQISDEAWQAMAEEQASGDEAA